MAQPQPPAEGRAGGGRVPCSLPAWAPSRTQAEASRAKLYQGEGGRPYGFLKGVNEVLQVNVIPVGSDVALEELPATVLSPSPGTGRPARPQPAPGKMSTMVLQNCRGDTQRGKSLHLSLPTRPHPLPDQNLCLPLRARAWQPRDPRRSWGPHAMHWHLGTSSLLTRCTIGKSDTKGQASSKTMGQPSPMKEHPLQQGIPPPPPQE